MSSDYERLVDDLVASIETGYDVEGDHPSGVFVRPTDDHIRWLAAWILSEGWERR